MPRMKKTETYLKNIEKMKLQFHILCWGWGGRGRERKKKNVMRHIFIKIIVIPNIILFCKNKKISFKSVRTICSNQWTFEKPP